MSRNPEPKDSNDVRGGERDAGHNQEDSDDLPLQAKAAGAWNVQVLGEPADSATASSAVAGGDLQDAPPRPSGTPHLAWAWLASLSS